MTWTSWCATDNEPATFRCRESHHDVRDLLADAEARIPSTDDLMPGWQPLGESTSARLRRVEAELGSALSALTTAREERDELTRLLLDAREEISKLQTRLAHAKGSEPCAYRGLAEQLLREREERRQP